MSLFEFEDGQLIPAQFGRPISGGISPAILDAVRSQVLDLLARPLFPITWRDLARVADGSTEPRLTALDSAGQVVSVEITGRLDSQSLIASLSRTPPPCRGRIWRPSIPGASTRSRPGGCASPTPCRRRPLPVPG